MRRKALMFGALALSLTLTSCSADTPQPQESENSQSASAAPTPTADPVFIPEGSAEENLPFFTFIVKQALATEPEIDSAALAQKVAEAGFPAEGIQFSYSSTAVGLKSDTADVASNFAGACLIAQYGPVQPEPHIVVMPALAQGGCLIGAQIQRLG